MVDDPTPTQDEADSMKLVSHGHDADAEAPTVVDVPAVTVGGSVVASCNVGDTLDCTMGNWNGEPTGYSAAWLAGSATVGNGPSYTARAGDAGQDISCMVTAANAVGVSQVRSNAVSVSPPA